MLIPQPILERYRQLQWIRQLKTEFPSVPNEPHRTLAQTVCSREQTEGGRKIHKRALILHRVTVWRPNRQGHRHRHHGIPACPARSTGNDVHLEESEGSDDLSLSSSPSASQVKPPRQ